jgi:predicted transcriptional regulator
MRKDNTGRAVAQPLLAVWVLPRQLDLRRVRGLQNHTAKSRCATEANRNSKMVAFRQEVIAMRKTNASAPRTSAALKSQLDDRGWQLAEIRKGRKDERAGRIVSHSKTVRWLRSWGKKRELPPPLCE